MWPCFARAGGARGALRRGHGLVGLRGFAHGAGGFLCAVPGVSWFYARVWEWVLPSVLSCSPQVRAPGLRVRRTGARVARALGRVCRQRACGTSAASS